MKTLKLDIHRLSDLAASISDTDLGRLFRAMLAYAAGGEPSVTGKAQRCFERVRPEIDRQAASFAHRSETNTRNVTNRYESYTNRRRIVDESYAEEREGASPLCPPSPLSPGTPISTPPYNPPTPEREECPPHPSDEAPTGAKPKRGTAFTPPSLAEVEAYAEAAGLRMDSAAFVDHFTANGWKVSGRAPMKDWKAAARNWARNESRFKQGNAPPRHEPRSSQYTNAALEALEVQL